MLLLVTLGIISFGLMAGIYFAFSGFIMTSFAKMPESSGMIAMQVINDTILKSSFMIFFWGTTILSAFFIVYGTLNESGALLISAGLVYFVGMFLCTVLFNVPLNNKLKNANAETKEGQMVWDEYLRKWTRFNHCRTMSCCISCGLLVTTSF